MPQLTFYIWEPILAAYGLAYNDALLSRPSVFPSIHVFHNYPDATNYNPPGTGTTYTTPTDNPAGVARAIANWHTHNTANVVGKPYTSRPVYLCIHNTGYWNATNPSLSSGDNATLGIFRHPSDVLSGINSSVSPFEAYLGPYCDTGRSSNASLQSSIASSLEGLVAGGMNLGYIDHDIETLPDYSYSLPGTTADRWLDEYLADARFGTEIAWDGNSHNDVWAPVTAADADASPNTSQGFYHSSNDAFRSWVSQVFGKNLTAWAFKKAVADPWKSVYPNVKVGNYELFHSEPVPGHTLYLDRSLTVDREVGNGFLDFDSPQLYEAYKFQFRLDSQANFEADVTTQLAGHGLTTTGDVELDIIKISVAQAKAKIAMCHAGGRDAIFWIRDRTQDTSLMSAFGYEWLYTITDWWEIVKFALDRGFRKFVIFTGTGVIGAQPHADLVTIVSMAEAYVRRGDWAAPIGSGRLGKSKVTFKKGLG